MCQVVIGKVPDRGGRTNETRPRASDMMPAVRNTQGAVHAARSSVPPCCQYAGVPLAPLRCAKRPPALALR
jgi:hypothetical protein